MRKSRIFLTLVALVLVLGTAFVFTSSTAQDAGAVAAVGSTLTVRYYTNNDGTGDAVSGLSVYVKKNGSVVASRGGVNGSTSFGGLADGDYTIDSVKGASSRTGDAVNVSGDTTKDIPSGKLITKYYTNNDGSGDAVTGLSVYVKWAATMGDVDSRGGVNGTTSFALLAGDYKVVSVKGASSRTDAITVASDNTLNVPSGKLITKYYTNNDGTGDPVTGLSVYVKWAATMGDVDSRGGVNGTTSFALLAGDYKVVSVKGASSRTDAATVASDNTLNVPSGKLTTRYYCDNDGTGDPVTGLSVYVKWAATMGDVDSRGGVNGQTSFALLAGDYKVVSVKGASSRTDAATVASNNILDVPSGELILNYNTNNDGTAVSSGTGTNVTGLSVYVKFNGGDVASAGGVSGTVSFALLSNTGTGKQYSVVSVKGASTRTDSGIDLASDTVKNIPSGKLIVTYYANDNAAWGLTGVSTYVKWSLNNGDVDSRGGVNGQTSFALLSTTGTGTTYKVVSVKGASSRTEDGVTVASDQTLDVPVARFLVMVLKADFTPQTGVSVYVKTAAGGDVDSRGGVNGSTQFSLLQSANGGGAGSYKFVAVHNSTTAQTVADANEGPPDGPPGLAGVVLLVP